MAKQPSLRLSAYERLRYYTHEVEPIDTGSHQWSTLFLARIALLRALEVYVPNILSELRQIQIDHRNEAPQLWEVLWSDPMNDALEVLPLFPDCGRSVLELLSRYSLSNTKHHWILRVLISYLWVEVKPQMAHTAFKVAVLPPLTTHGADVTGKDFNFGAAAWNPTVETRINYETRVSKTFEMQLRKYITQMRYEAMEKGVSNYEPQRLREGLVPTDAIRFIQYQIMQKSFERIADMEADVLEKHVPKQTVTKGIQRYAALTGVLLRPKGRSGRKQTRNRQ